MLPNEYLKDILPDDIYELYENVKTTGYKYLTREKVNENRKFYTELYLNYLDNKLLFLDNIKNQLFGGNYDIEDYSTSDWCSITLALINFGITIEMSGFLKYYNIYYRKEEFNKEEKEYIKNFEKYMKLHGYKKYDEEKLMLVTMDILGYEFETKEDLLKIFEKKYKKLYSGNKYFLDKYKEIAINNKGNDYRQEDFKFFMYDELNQGKYMNVDHLLFSGDSMF